MNRTLQAVMLLLALASTIACSLTTSSANPPQNQPIVVIATQQPVVFAPTSTPRPTNTPQPTSTPPQQTSGGSVYVPPAYSVRQPVPAATCGLIPLEGTVNIRSGPGTNFPVLGVLPAANWALARWQNDTGRWYQVSLPRTPVDGGWISADVASLQAPCTCSPNGACTASSPVSDPPTPLPPSGVCAISTSTRASVTVYNEPSTGAGVFRTLDYSYYMPVAGTTSDGWYAVSANTGIVPNVGLYAYRWVRQDAQIKLDGPCSGLPVFNYQLPAMPVQCILQVRAGSGSVPMYFQPALANGLLGMLDEGTPVYAYGITADGWYGVDPGAPTSPSVGIFRLKWIQVSAPVEVVGCSGLPTISYSG